MDIKKKYFKAFFLTFVIISLVFISLKTGIKTIKENKMLSEFSSLDLQIKDKQTDNITLSWENFVIEDGSNISSYKVYVNDEYVATTIENSYVFSNLDSGKDYNFSVEFLNYNNEVVIKKEITNVQTAKVINGFSGQNVYPKDVYYIKTDTLAANVSAKFEAGCVLKFEKKEFRVVGKLELAGTENDRIVVVSSNYQGVYN